MTKKVFFISFLIESLLSLMIILIAPFGAIWAASINLLSFVNVAAMGYWIRKEKIALWKIFVLGSLLLVLGGAVSVAILILSGNFDQMVFFGLMLSSVIFAPLYGILSAVGAYIQDRVGT